ncbi:hypothetical protein BD560DRAFT_384421 [Blakeslea trispora]|nr:hypothetical protein BD560DRAFT_384421 [Blakeslea trispora]
MLTTTIQEYPVSFAEAIQSSQDTPFYVEWLDNSSEFPGLATTTTTLDKESWELLRRKELQETELQPMEEVGDWTKIGSQPSLYADIAQKNATKPLSLHHVRSVKPKTDIQPKKQEEEKEEDKVEVVSDELNADLLLDRKAYSRRANILGRKRQKHDMEIVRLNMEVVFRLATSKNGTLKVNCYSQGIHAPPSSLLSGIQESYLKEFRVNTKAQALSFAAKYKHNTKKYNAVYAGIIHEESKRFDIYDSSDLPVVRK